MTAYLRRHLPFFILLLGIASFILYFSLFSINRFQKSYAHYFDLGIMHQTTYNSYMALKTGDLSRFLEMTDPHASLDQVKRMSVHNDILLGLISPFYFIHSGPGTLLILQTTIVAIGAYILFLIALEVFKKQKYAEWIALSFAISYLLYPPLQKAVNFDFHAVTLAPTFLLGMYYCGMKKRYVWSGVFALLTLTTKEQVGLVVMMYGVYLLWNEVRVKREKLEGKKESSLTKNYQFPRFIDLGKIRKIQGKKLTFITSLIVVGLGWVLLSMLFIIPNFRGGEHFGAEYYDYLIANPLNAFPVLFRYETFHYVFILLAPAGLLALFSPFHLAIAGSEFATNILSSNGNMRNIYFHYDTALTAFVFIASVFGGKNVLEWLTSVRVSEFFKKKLNYQLSIINYQFLLIGYLLLFTSLYSLYMSPLPWGRHRDMAAWAASPAKMEDVTLWQQYLADDQLKVSTTGHLAPHFTSRQYYYDFAGGYELAEYIVIDTWHTGRGFQGEVVKDQYNKLQNDWKYIRIYEKNGIEVYKRLGKR